MLDFYKGKKVLVTGGTGMIGIPLVKMLVENEAKVRIASLDEPSRAHEYAEFKRVNLMQFNKCMELCAGIDYIFHLAGVKGSTEYAVSKPASFFVPILTINTNMMEAARLQGVERYLYTSTVGVYAPAEIMHENDVWKTFPSENDRFAGWAKRMGELQAEAYKIEYGWDCVSIVRPANVYGSYDNFGPGSMVIPSLIKRAIDGENPLVVWGDGSAIRDFIHAEDVARGMMLVLEKGIKQPVNLGSGKGITIRELVEIIVSNLEKRPIVIWDTSKPSGDRKRVLDTYRASSIGFKPVISLEAGINQTMEWYQNRKEV